MPARPRLASYPPIWLEARLPIEVAALLRDPVLAGLGVPDGEGQPVLLIPGFLAGDDSLGLMTYWLRRTGYRTRRAGIRLNVSCSEAAVERLERRLEQHAERHQRRVVIVGQSRGGAFARVLAVRRPELVSGIVTLGTPHLDSLAVHPVVRAQITLLGALGTVGLPGLFSRDCTDGHCCDRYYEDLGGRFPSGVGHVSIYSRSDGIVDWRACLDPSAELAEVNSSHCGMSVNPDAYRIVALALARFRAGESRRGGEQARRTA